MKRDITIAGQPENKVGLEKLRVGVLGMGFMGGTHTFAWKNGGAILTGQWRSNSPRSLTCPRTASL
ncbi:MAG: hypothetical protein AAFZ02_01565 [Pseudomonadota bacterium]